jgi:surfeit locus 1 family protein
VAVPIYLPLLGQRLRRSGFFFYLLGLILLISLGVWQCYRLQWKTTLIQKLHQAQSGSPLPLKDALEKSDPYFHPVCLEGLIESPVFYLIGKPLNGKAGYHAIVRLRTKEGKRVLVTLGWTPDKNTILKCAGMISLHGIIQPIEKSIFSPAHVIPKNEWGSIDLEKMGGDMPFYVKATAIPACVKGVRALPTIPTLRNHHLSYAITWFILALFWGIGGWRFLRRG